MRLAPSTWMFWDAAHCVDEDPEGFIAWMGDVARSDAAPDHAVDSPANMGRRLAT